MESECVWEQKGTGAFNSWRDRLDLSKRANKLVTD